MKVELVNEEDANPFSPVRESNCCKVLTQVTWFFKLQNWFMSQWLGPKLNDPELWQFNRLVSVDRKLTVAMQTFIIKTHVWIWIQTFNYCIFLGNKNIIRICLIREIMINHSNSFITIKKGKGYVYGFRYLIDLWLYAIPNMEWEYY